MENILGTEIFSELSSRHIGRILVSSFMEPESNPDITEAQNNGDVDIILSKTENFAVELPKAILAAKNKFFTALSNLLYPNAPAGHPLSDSEFAKFYISKINELKPKEIRANSKFTRFTFVGADDQPSYVLNITSEKEIQETINSQAAETVPSDLIAHLASGKYMLCHNECDEVLPDGKLWPLFIRPAEEFRIRDTKFFYNISEYKYGNIPSSPLQNLEYQL